MDRLNTLINDKSNKLDNDVRQVLQSIEGYDNIPRKRAKFINFCKNALGRKFAPAIIEKTWDVFEATFKGPKEDVTKTNNDNKEIKVTDSSSEKENGTMAMESESIKCNSSKDGISKFKGTTKSKEENKTDSKKSKKQKKRKAFEEQPNCDLEDLPAKKKAKKPTTEPNSNNSGEEESVVAKFDWIQCISAVVEKKGSIKSNKLKKKVVNEYCQLYPDTVKSRIELETKFEKKLGKCKKFKILNDVVQISMSRS